MRVEALLVSPVHAYEGRPTEPPRPDPAPLSVPRAEVHAHLGLAGDRYHNREAHRQASVTVFSADALDEVAAELGLPHLPVEKTRRNIILRGFPVDDLAATRAREGAVFSLDTGAGPIRFQAHRPAHPCRWMDTQLAPGAFKAMRGRGGVRCAPLDSGFLVPGPATLLVP
ncbi:MOSC domain-containing protein [Actinokineospora sp. PR83]|uniref:MOSC domain-containing protein n=1 Tax=Actinokineospora sp. PR83 TaxID=2884908 RepID=UPI0027DF5AF8|nr:MOSC domain-containing protein [Actinokineospora sp. PR83]MCG8920400.1 MOSC domain-containing protein [Actinokineospora sp. PR83]